MREARLLHTDAGLAPDGEGWFVVNARAARWGHIDEMGSYVWFEPDEPEFAQFGVNVHVLRPGQPNGLYHGEAGQEDFLVLSGECLLIVEGQERRLRQWDFVHCPSWTEHIFVGAGDGPCAILMVGARGRKGIHYPVNETARRHGAGVDRETDSGREAYARVSDPQPGPYRDGDLPD
jgi:uncharacterized cupin superfamily protein